MLKKNKKKNKKNEKTKTKTGKYLPIGKNISLEDILKITKKY